MKNIGFAILSCLAVTTALTPNCLALSTAKVTSDITFTVNASVGTLKVQSSSGMSSADIDIPGVGTDSRFDSGAPSSVVALVGSNTASANTGLFYGHSEVDIGVPGGEFGMSVAKTSGSASLKLNDYGGATKFDLTINPFAASIGLDLFNDSEGLVAYGAGEYVFTLSYTAGPWARGSKEESRSVFLGIEQSDAYSNLLSDSRILTFSNIPTSLFSLTLSWTTRAEAGVYTAVPESDGTAPMLALGFLFLGLGWRSSKGCRPPFQTPISQRTAAGF